MLRSCQQQQIDRARAGLCAGIHRDTTGGTRVDARALAERDELGEPKAVFTHAPGIGDFVPSPDTRRFLMAVPADGGGSPVRAATVILNATSGLKR